MKYIIPFFLFIISSSSFAQTKLEYGTPNYMNQKLGKHKFEECKLDISINYQDKQSDLMTANELLGKEIVVLATKGKKIKGYLRGYIEIENNIIYFNPIGDHITSGKMSNMVFDYKGMNYFDGKCFDEKNK